MADSSKPQRKSIRLKNYDYSTPGYYFVTICTEGRKCLLGEIHDGKMELNPLGEKVQAVWSDLPKHCPGVELDIFVVMPNHLHGVLALNVGAGSHARPGAGQAQRPAPTLSLPDVIQRFKSFSTHLYRETLAKTGNSFSTKLWQRNYYEHVIRRDESLEKIRKYIQENPLKWDLDEDNPLNITSPKK
ncbi:MAG TPA: transposase [bacterium]|nr:transposase [bacterium]